VTGGRRAGEAGYAMAALLAGAAILLIALTAAVPSWRYVMKNEREQELIFRGGQIADAVQRFQKKNGNALPASMEVLVKGKYLRKAYADPMAKDGKWRFLRQGEGVGAPRPTTPGTPTTTRPSGPAPMTLGGFTGVVSTSSDKGLRLFNGKEKYDEWAFIAGQARVIGKAPRIPGGGPSPGLPPLPGLPSAPGAPPGPVNPPDDEAEP
jgi:type II secretory pathway pseudopilin PulG